MADEDGFELSTGEHLKDGVRAVVLGAVGSVPVFGALMTELLDVAMPRIFERRVNTLLQQIDARIGHLEVASDETMATVVALAAQAAITADDEKIAYLANAVANAATGREWQLDTATILLRLVADLTATHMRVLDLLVDPSDWTARTGVHLEAQGSGDMEDRPKMLTVALGKAGTPISDIYLVLVDLRALGIYDPAVTELGRRVHSFVTWTDPDSV